MNEENDRPEPDKPEGVRIIRAEEAAEALERDDVVRRRGPDEPRPGDRPESDTGDKPQPVMRFPLSSSSDADSTGQLPHWTEPPTGAHPLFGDEETGGDDDWASITSGTPRWRDEGDDWREEDDASFLGLDEGERLGALDDSERPDPDDFFTFDELSAAPPGRSVFDDEGDADADDEYDYEYDEGVEPEPDRPARPSTIVVGGGRVSPPSVTRSRGSARAVGADRDMPQAVVVGAGFLAVAMLSFVIGPAVAALLVIAVLTAAAVEFYTAVRRVEYRPAALVGVVAVAGLALATFHRGEAAYPAVLAVALVATLLWYLVGAGEGQVVLNAGVTLLGVAWIGVLGSFATMLLAVRGPGIGDAGKGILFGAVLCTVGYDVGGYFVGRSAGRSPLSAASPNKTVEGLLGGCVLAVVVGVVYGMFTEPMGSLGDGLLLGLAAAVAAPVGDLCQSMIKRDLGIKDMGALLPGHGGLLDRFDALLFVLPSVYFVAQLRDFFV